jgi:hypothetical protein
LQEGGRAVDPFGARVMNVQPPDSTEEMANTHVFGPPYSGTSWSQFTNANNFTTGCSVDGVRTTCRSALEAISHGLADGVIQGPGAGGAAGVLALFGIAPIVHTIPQPGDSERRPEDFTVWVEFVPTGGGETTNPTDPQNPENKDPISCGKVELLDNAGAGYKRGPLAVPQPANVVATGVRMNQAPFPNTFRLTVDGEKIDPNGVLAVRVSFHSSEKLEWEPTETRVSTNEGRVNWNLLGEFVGQPATQTDFQERFAEITFRVKASRGGDFPTNTIDVKVGAARKAGLLDINNPRFRPKEFQTCRIRLYREN